MKESAKMPAIKFDRQNKTLSPWVLAQRAARGREKERDTDEKDGKRKRV